MATATADPRTALAQKRLAWRNGLSEEDQLKLQAERAAWVNEETKAAKMQEFMEVFTASDADSNGLLDKAEFQVFITKLGQSAGNRGAPYQDESDFSAEEKELIFGLFNAHTEDVDGVSVADFFAVMQEVGDRMREIEGQTTQ